MNFYIELFYNSFLQIFNLRQAESWPCDLQVPDIPQEVFYPAAAVLGKVGPMTSRFLIVYKRSSYQQLLS